MRTAAAVTTIVLAAAALAPAPRTAHGATDATGNLGTGGTAKGDIAKRAGETDTISVDLQAGSRVDIRWSSGFSATVGFFDPQDQAIDVALGGKQSSVLDWLVPETGRYEFRIASATAGSQGVYKLTVQPGWDRKLTFEGTGEATFDVPMPAASTLKAKVEAASDASNPSILSFRSPQDDELLLAPVVGSDAVAKLKPTACATAGVYRFTSTAAAGTQHYVATFKRHTMRIPLTRIDISNGLDPISFANDGVDDYFKLRCASCHGWASSYSGVRAFATLALGRMKSGSMPQNGPRADAATIDLVDQWIRTGYGR